MQGDICWRMPKEVPHTCPSGGHGKGREGGGPGAIDLLVEGHAGQVGGFGRDFLALGEGCSVGSGMWCLPVGLR